MKNNTPPKPLRVDGVLFNSRMEAETLMGVASGTLSKKLKLKTLPCTIRIKGVDYRITKP